MNTLIALPLLFSLVMSVLAFLIRGRKGLELIGLLGFIILSAMSAFVWWHVYKNGVHFLEVGGWPSPYGIVLRADLFSSSINFFTSILGLCAYLFSLDEIRPRRSSAGYYSAMFTLTAGAKRRNR